MSVVFLERAGTGDTEGEGTSMSREVAGDKILELVGVEDSLNGVSGGTSGLELYFLMRGLVNCISLRKTSKSSLSESKDKSGDGSDGSLSSSSIITSSGNASTPLVFLGTAHGTPSLSSFTGRSTG